MFSNYQYNSYKLDLTNPLKIIIRLITDFLLLNLQFFQLFRISILLQDKAFTCSCKSKVRCTVTMFSTQNLY